MGHIFRIKIIENRAIFVMKNNCEFKYEERYHIM